MNMKLILTSAMIASLVLPFGASADGEQTKTVVETREVCTTTYGGGTECKTVEVPREEIVHEPVDTGIVENASIAIALFISGYLVMLLAKRYEVIK